MISHVLLEPWIPINVLACVVRIQMRMKQRVSLIAPTLAFPGIVWMLLSTKHHEIKSSR